MNEVSTDPRQNVGVAVRDLRQLRKISARTLASMISRSPAFVSQMERNLSVPSLKDIYAIAAALRVPVNYFLQDVPVGPDEERNLIVRKANRRIIENSGVTTAILSPRMRDGIEFNETTFLPLASTQITKFDRKGFETGILVSGRLNMTFCGSSFALEAGDSYCLKLDEFHSSHNPSKTECAILVWTINSEQ